MPVVSARTSPDPALLKPNPFLVQAALAELDVRPDVCTLVGDSVTDIQAAHAAGTLAIGDANKPGKTARLSGVGADAITASVVDLVELARNPTH